MKKHKTIKMQKKFGKNIASLQNKALSLPRNVEHWLLITEKGG